MKESNSFLTLPRSIVIGSLILSVSILMHGGIIKVGAKSAAKPNAVAAAPAGQPSQPAQQPAVAPSPKAKVDVSAGHLPVKGNDKAKVTVVEFADFQCPFCERFYTQVEINLLKDYVDTGKVKFAFRNYAFLGQESTWAAEASECANEQNKFWEYHDYLYTHQGKENAGDFSKEKLEGFAQAIGLNTDQFKSCLESDKYAAKVKEDFTQGQAAGVQGTPATFINGQLVSGAQPYSNFKSIIDAELAK